jgi:hypothetical protein
MKRTLAVLFVAAVAFLFTGCQTREVVQTRIKYDRSSGTFDLISPKDVQIASLNAQTTADGGLSLELTDYAATANAAAVQAAGAETAAIAKLAEVIANMAALRATDSTPLPKTEDEEAQGPGP